MGDGNERTLEIGPSIMLRVYTFLLTTSLWGIVLLSSGCISYRTGGLANTELPKQSGTSQSRQSALIEITCQTRYVSQNVASDDVAAAQAFRAVLAGVFDDSGVFSRYTFSALRGTNADLRVVFALRHEQHGSLVGMVLSAATLCVIPFTGSDTYHLSTRLIDKNGNEAWTCSVEDSMRTWIQLFLLPLGSWKSEEKARNQLLENLVRTTLVRMKADINRLQPDNLQGHPAGGR
jgi:hypothetical protein